MTVIGLADASAESAVEASEATYDMVSEMSKIAGEAVQEALSVVVCSLTSASLALVASSDSSGETKSATDLPQAAEQLQKEAAEEGTAAWAVGPVYDPELGPVDRVAWQHACRAEGIGGGQWGATADARTRFLHWPAGGLDHLSPPLDQGCHHSWDRYPSASTAARSRSRQDLGCGCGPVSCVQRLRSSLSRWRGPSRAVGWGVSAQGTGQAEVGDSTRDVQDEDEGSCARQREDYQESCATAQRHRKEAGWSPAVLLYDASADPPAETGAERQRRMRRAYQIPCNSPQASRVENENFEGSFLFLHREPSAELNPSGTASPHAAYFANKSRRWEARLQGKFRRRPAGTLYVGCVLEDFDYSTDNSWAAHMLAAAVVPLMEAVIGERFYFSWGTRGRAAEEANAELGAMVTCLTGLDQVVVTPAAEAPPDLHGDLSGLGMCRSAMTAAEYRIAVQSAADEINTEDTYTLCLWGVSRHLDVLRSSFADIPLLGSFSYASFIDDWPAHFVLYSLEENDTDPRHLERRKDYFVDVMVYSSAMSVPTLPWRYRLLDQQVRESSF